MSLQGKRLVVDADVGRAAANPARIERGEQVDARARQIRRCLAEVQDGGHTVVLCPTLRAEWDKHAPAGSAGRAWLARMAERRLVLKVPQSPTDPSLDACIAERLPPDDQPVARKDLHLVTLALQHADRRVLSLDARAREKFARLRDDHAGLGGLYWAAPDTEAAEKWLRDGAKDDPAFRL